MLIIFYSRFYSRTRYERAAGKTIKIWLTLFRCRIRICTNRDRLSRATGTRPSLRRRRRKSNRHRTVRWVETAVLHMKWDLKNHCKRTYIITLYYTRRDDKLLAVPAYAFLDFSLLKISEPRFKKDQLVSSADYVAYSKKPGDHEINEYVFEKCILKLDKSIFFTTVMIIFKLI